MSQLIDSRIVEMRFDNKDFEKNVSSTQKSLQSLEKSLRLTESAEAFKNIDNSAKNINFNNLANNVQSLSDRFSTMGIVGMQVIARLTNAAIDASKKIASMVLSPIASGGWARSMNIETAKFQLEGLSVAWEDIADDIDYGVKDTAYGLDAAAKVAAQLVASNIEVGDSMKTALRAVSGVAAMTSSEYENIGDVFTKVAGQGRVMGDDLLRLSARGLNAAATIAKHLGKSEAAVRKMVTEGQIDFATFAAAMDEAFGQHAKDANKTFTGAMSNIRAAMSRIGADFATPFIRNSIGVLNEIRVAINGVREVTKPLAREFDYFFIRGFSRYLKFLIGGKQVTDSLKASVQSLANIFKAVVIAIKPVQAAFKDVFPVRIRDVVYDLALAFQEFTSKLTVSSNVANKLRSVFRGLFAFVDIIRIGFKTFLQAISPGVDIIKNLGGNVLDLAAALGEYVVSIDNAIRRNQTFVTIFTPIRKVFDFLKAGLNGALGFIKEITPMISKAIGNLGGAIKNSLNGVRFMDVVRTLSITAIAKAITGFLISLSTAVQDIKTSARGIIVSFKAIFVNLNMYLRDLTAQVKAGIIMDIAKAVALLAVSLLLISMIDPQRLGNALSMITVLMIELYTMMSALQKLNGLQKDVGMLGMTLNNINFSLISAQIISVGAAMILLAAAAKILSTIDAGELLKTMGAIGVFLLFLYGFFKNMASIEGKIPRIGTSILLLSVGLIAFAAAMKILSTIDFDGIITSFGAIGALLTSFYYFTNKTDASSISMLAFAASLTILSIGLIAFATSIKILSSIPFDNIITSMAAVAAYMYSFVYISKMASKCSFQMITLAASLTILSVGLMAFAVSIKMLSTIPIDQIGFSMLAVIGYIGAFTAIVNKLSASVPKMISFAGALTLISAGLLIMSSAFKVMSKISLDSMVISFALFLGLMKSLAVLSSGTLKVGNMLAFSGAIIVLSTGLRIFASALKVLESVNVDGVVGGLIAFAGAVLIVTVLAKVLEPFIFTILEFAAAIALLGAGLGLISWGLSGFGNILGGLGKALGGIFTGIKSAFGLMDGEAFEVGEDLDSEIASGITSNGDVVVNAASDVADRAVSESQWDVPPPNTTEAETQLSDLELQIGSTRSEVDTFTESTNAAAEALDNEANKLKETEQAMERAQRSMANLNSQDYINRRDSYLLGDFNAEYELARNASRYIELNPKEFEALHSSVRNGKIELEGYASSLQTVQHYTTVAASEFRTYDDVLRAVTEAEIEMENRMGPNYAEFVQEHGQLTAQMVTGLSEYELQTIRTADAQREMEERLGPNTFAARMEETEAQARAMNSAMDELEQRLGPNGAQAYLQAAAESNGAFAQSLLTAKERLEALGWTTDQIDGMFSNLQTTIKDQISVFEEFSAGSKITAEQVLSNMQSQLDGINSWADNMTTLSNKLAEYDLTTGIYEQLAQMGPQGAAYVEAFASMSEEQLRNAAAMFDEINLLPENASEQIMSGMATIAEDATSGFVDNLDSSSFYDAGVSALGDDGAIGGAREGAGTQSPSWKTKEIAINCIRGFQIGLQQSRSMAINASRMVATAIISTFANEMPSSKFETFGQNVGIGLVNGMNSMQDAVRNAAANLARIAKESTQNVLQVYSPSRISHWIGEMFGLGMVNGISAYSTKVQNEAENLGDSAINGLNNSIDYISKIITDEIDLNPVITPVLDLSNVTRGVNTIDNMFNSRRSVASTTGVASTDGEQDVGSIVYNQYNYSPKALNRSEIYRQTKNQLSRAVPYRTKTALAGG